MKEFKDNIDLWLHEYFNNKDDYNKKLYDAMEYSIKVGGKRIRPILLLTTYSMYKKDIEEAMPLACALEMIHTYSLIHDDLPCMDNDDLRRGKATSHKVFGEAIAVLAGDALLNEAMNIMFKCSAKSSLHLKASTEIAFAAGPEGMIGGQLVDIEGENRKISLDELNYMHSKKTGALINVSIIAGAILGNASLEHLEKLSLFGKKLGLAFQIKDDILDVIGDVDKLGKKISSDNNNNKTTYITEFGLKECKIICEELTDECYKILNSIEVDTTDLKKITTFLLNRDF
ncbi:geranylgeranyl diphosphate synthase, type II [Clostridium grantii DSM 8605]|uniref:Farnesyl diphosphate synthase n=2 Tax=Clostridium TaxID=1485 RepID=A0A1M5SEQ6_9CLOT|nr:geranylgeranyl diphosphate synthase, type II [Clostridium grantii DSM 8605]